MLRLTISRTRESRLTCGSTRREMTMSIKLGSGSQILRPVLLQFWQGPKGSKTIPCPLLSLSSSSYIVHSAPCLCAFVCETQRSPTSFFCFALLSNPPPPPPPLADALLSLGEINKTAQSDHRSLLLFTATSLYSALLPFSAISTSRKVVPWDGGAGGRPTDAEEWKNGKWNSTQPKYMIIVVIIKRRQTQTTVVYLKRNKGKEGRNADELLEIKKKKKKQGLRNTFENDCFAWLRLPSIAQMTNGSKIDPALSYPEADRWCSSSSFLSFPSLFFLLLLKKLDQQQQQYKSFLISPSNKVRQVPETAGAYDSSQPLTSNLNLVRLWHGIVQFICYWLCCPSGTALYRSARTVTSPACSRSVLLCKVVRKISFLFFVVKRPNEYRDVTRRAEAPCLRADRSPHLFSRCLHSRVLHVRCLNCFIHYFSPHV